jgi:hypothetical protein
MTCWFGWYIVYWAEVSPMNDTRKEKTGRICMIGKGTRALPGTGKTSDLYRDDGRKKKRAMSAAALSQSVAIAQRLQLQIKSVEIS